MTGRRRSFGDFRRRQSTPGRSDVRELPSAARSHDADRLVPARSAVKSGPRAPAVPGRGEIAAAKNRPADRREFRRESSSAASVRKVADQRAQAAALKRCTCRAPRAGFRRRAGATSVAASANWLPRRMLQRRSIIAALLLHTSRRRFAGCRVGPAPYGTRSPGVRIPHAKAN